MNIFYVDSDYQYCARSLDNKRVCKMILETAQMMNAALSIAHPAPDFIRSLPLKPTHLRHPCVKWVATSKSHYDWTYKYFYYLLAEYQLRFGKVHSYNKHKDFFYNNSNYIPKGKWVNPPNVTDFKHDTNICNAYKRHLLKKWDTDKRTPIWYIRQIPCWRLPELPDPVDQVPLAAGHSAIADSWTVGDWTILPVRRPVRDSEFDDQHNDSCECDDCLADQHDADCECDICLDY